MRPLYFYSLRVILLSCFCIICVVLALMSLPSFPFCSIVSSYALMPYAPPPSCPMPPLCLMPICPCSHYLACRLITAPLTSLLGTWTWICNNVACIVVHYLLIEIQHFSFIPSVVLTMRPS